MTLRAADILVLGTMKGGTTNLWTILRQHPQAVMGSTKEIHYFTLNFEKPLSWYENQFPNRDAHTLAVDASPTYFDMADTEEIPRRIKSVVPNARLILCVRNPVERSISHYYQLKKSEITGRYFDSIGINDFFQQALNDSWDRTNPFGDHFRYSLEFSIYESKFANYNAVFGAGKLLVLDNDEVIRDQRRAMSRVFSHCGIADISQQLPISESYPLQRRSSELSSLILTRMEEILYPHYAEFTKMVRAAA